MLTTSELLISPLCVEYGSVAIYWVPNSFSDKGSKLKGQLKPLICLMPIRAKTVLIKQSQSMKAL